MREGWELKPLNEVCQIRPPKREAKEVLGENDFVSFVPMKVLGEDEKSFNSIENKKLSEVTSSYTYFKNNDVLLAKITPCFENGKLGIAKNLTNEIGFGSSEFIVYRALDSLHPEYLYYFLSQESFRIIGKSQMTGAVGHKRIPKEFYERYKIPVPPLKEQKQIVNTLDKAFNQIDQAKENLEQNLHNAKELFQSKLNEVFSQRGEGWVEKRLGDVCSVLNGYAFKSKDVIDNSNTQLLRMGNLYQNKLDLGRKPVFYPDSFADEYSDYLLKENDLIMSLTGTVDKTDYGYTVRIDSTEVNLLLNQRIMKIDVLDNNILDSRYLHSFLLSPDFLEKLYATANGTRQANLSSRTILTLTLPMPKLEIQKSIVKELDKLNELSNNLQTHYQQKLNNLEELKKSILQKAFRGEL